MDGIAIGMLIMMSMITFSARIFITGKPETMHFYCFSEGGRSITLQRASFLPSSLSDHHYPTCESFPTIFSALFLLPDPVVFAEKNQENHMKTSRTKPILSGPHAARRWHVVSSVCITHHRVQEPCRLLWRLRQSPTIAKERKTDFQVKVEVFFRMKERPEICRNSPAFVRSPLPNPVRSSSASRKLPGSLAPHSQTPSPAASRPNRI